MVYKLWASLALVGIVVVGWVAAAFVMNWYLQTQPLPQLLAWLLISAVSVWAVVKGTLKVWHGDRLMDVLNSPWD